MMTFVLQMMKIAFKMMKFVFKMVIVARTRSWGRRGWSYLLWGTLVHKYPAQLN